MATGVGEWMVKLDRMAASDEPRVLTVGEVRISDVLVGWNLACVGPVEYGLVVKRYDDGGGYAIAAATDPLLRLGRVTISQAEQQQTDLRGVPLVPCTSTEAATFSAVAYTFARDLRKALKNVPVGIIVDAMAASSAEAFTPRTTLEADPELLDYIEKFEQRIRQYDPVAAQRQYEAVMLKYHEEVNHG